MKKPKEFLDKKVYYLSDLKLKGWRLVSYQRGFTNGVNEAVMEKNGVKDIFMVY